LEAAHGVVGDVADGAAGEARRTGDRDQAVLAQERAQRLERVVDLARHRGLTRCLDLHPPTARPEDACRLGAEEAVASPLLAALDALEEKAVGAAMHLEE